MKKTLIALAVAVFATSGTAIAALGAFSPSNTNNTITFGGSITPDHQDYNVWTWAVGQGYENFNNKISELTNDEKNLTITANENMPLLVGKFLNASIGNSNKSLSPQITFFDSKGRITPQWEGSNGIGQLTLTVNNAEQEEIGSANIGITAIAPTVWGNADGTGNLSQAYITGDYNGGPFYGSTGQFGGESISTTVSDNIMSDFGGLTFADLRALVNSSPNLGMMTPSSPNTVDTTGGAFTTSDHVYAGSYALGIRNGQSISITFASPITNETHWKAPLTMQISYG
ncbi:hypothetical protein NEM60_24605 [Escherichia coli]|nr:hypothetical protein [Escherichia coli]